MNDHPTFCGMLLEVEGGWLKAVGCDKEKAGQPGLSLHARPQQ
jgi:hypothetical protein